MSKKEYSIGVIGAGVVGQAVASFFNKSLFENPLSKGEGREFRRETKRRTLKRIEESIEAEPRAAAEIRASEPKWGFQTGSRAKLYDKFKSFDPRAEVLRQDLIFICVPTPYKDGFDRSILEEVFADIGRDKKERAVVIKSTAIPGTTDYFQEQYPHLRILFNPEFLTQKTAWQDFLKPDKQLIGFTKRSSDIAQSILDILPDAPYKKTMPAASAELVKYAVNAFYATKVVFGNMLYDLAGALGVDYAQVKEAFVSDRRIADSHFDVLHGGYRGYGGKCLPKDLLALVELAKKRGVDAGLLEKVDEMNRKYRQVTSDNWHLTK